MAALIPAAMAMGPTLAGAITYGIASNAGALYGAYQTVRQGYRGIKYIANKAKAVYQRHRSAPRSAARLMPLTRRYADECTIFQA